MVPTPGDAGRALATAYRRRSGLAIAVACVALALHAGLIWIGNTPEPRTLKGDELVYWPAAQALAAGEVVTEAEYSPLWPRGYLWFLAGLIEVFGASRWAVEGVQTLLLFLAAWMIRDLGRRWTGSAMAGDTAGILALLYPPLAAFAHYFWPETLHLFFFVTALWLLTRNEGKRGRLVTAGACLALAILTKSLLLPFLPLLLFVVMRNAEEPPDDDPDPHRRLAWERAAWVVLGLSVVLLPVRALTPGSSAPSAATFNLWLGWNDHGPPEETGRIAARGYTEYMASGATAAERDGVLRRRLFDQLRQADLSDLVTTQIAKQSSRLLHRETFLSTMLRGKSIHPAAAGYAAPPGWLAATLVGTAYWLYGVLLVGSVWAVSLASPRRGSWLWMAGLFLAYNLALFFFLHVKTRYRIQCLPFLFIFTGWSAAWLAARFGERTLPTATAAPSRVRAATAIVVSLLALYLAFGDLLSTSDQDQGGAAYAGSVEDSTGPGALGGAVDSEGERARRDETYSATMSTQNPAEIQTAFPAGHFYSPVIDPAEVARRKDQIWSSQPHVLGVKFDEAGHQHLLAEVFPDLLVDYDYPQGPPAATDGETAFFSGNPAFGWLDSRALFALLRYWRPRRLIEVGSGYSTLLIADVNTRFLAGTLDLTSIEPYPLDFLREPIEGWTRLVESQVEDVPLAEFERLEAGDVLFIDSSHVAKTGSDVNFLFFEVLPRLAPGVRIHVHDIFLPHEYPEDWVFRENRSWNEQYLVRALLMYSRVFRVVFGSAYAAHRFPELVAEALPEGRTMSGGSLWFERLADEFDEETLRS